jgi:hypothetical protein
VTPRRISELRALFEKATPAPWKQDKHCSIWAGPSTIDDPGYFVASAAYGIDREEADNRKNDSAFIAASRIALPEALDEIERLRAALEAVECTLAGERPLRLQQAFRTARAALGKP